MWGIPIDTDNDDGDPGDENAWKARIPEPVEPEPGEPAYYVWRAVQGEIEAVRRLDRALARLMVTGDEA